MLVKSRLAELADLETEGGNPLVPRVRGRGEARGRGGACAVGLDRDEGIDRDLGGGGRSELWDVRPCRLAPQIVQLRLACLELDAESGLTRFQVEAQSLLTGGPS